MADYIYLLQHRLTSSQRRALEAVRDAARSLGAPVFLVGGAVRDLTSGAPVRDLDFAVQGAVESLLGDLTVAGARPTGEDRSFHSRYFVFPGGIRVEVGPTLSVSYPQPGVPEVLPAPILDDLRRRDFTANAMAISLNEGSYGLLLDPLNGVADLENRELRLVSNLGFIEQPALLLRAARLGNRLGWTLEERTQRRYDNAKEEGAVERLSAQARGFELEEIFHEEDPASALEQLGSEGWLPFLSTALTELRPDHEGLDRVRDTLGQMEQLGIFADPSAVYFPLLTAKLPAAVVTEIKDMFARPGFTEQIDTLETRSRELGSQLTSKASSLPSATWKLLFGTEPEVVLALASASRTGAAQGKFKAFFTEWPQARQRIPYALMQEMRITPEIAGYDQLLEDLFFAMIDNKLSTPEETRAFLEPFSPPAPAQQAAPRRRAAKSARGRGRPAANAKSARSVDLDLEDGDEDADQGSLDTLNEDSESEKGSLGRSRNSDDPEDINDDDSGDAESNDNGEEAPGKNVHAAEQKISPPPPAKNLVKKTAAAVIRSSGSVPPTHAKKVVVADTDVQAGKVSAAAPTATADRSGPGDKAQPQAAAKTAAPSAVKKGSVTAAKATSAEKVAVPTSGAIKVAPAAGKGTSRPVKTAAVKIVSKPSISKPAVSKPAVSKPAVSKPAKAASATTPAAKTVVPAEKLAAKVQPTASRSPAAKTSVSAKKTSAKATKAAPAKRSAK